VAVRQRITVPFAGHVIGQGVNSDTAERVGTGLSVAQVGEDPVAPGQTAVFKFQMLTSQASLERALRIGAEVEARYALFSGGAKFDFAQSSAVNTSSTYIVASCAVTNALRSGSGFTPTDTADRLIRAGDDDGFREAFGDRFTEALRTGGELHALVRVTSSKVEHQRRISASLHAELNGLTAGGSFTASFEQAQSDATSHTEVDIQIHQTAGVGGQIQIPGTDAASIRAQMNRFAEAAHQNAAAYEAELVTYDTLALPFPPPEETEEKRRVLEDALQQRQRLWSALSDLRFAQSVDAEQLFADLPSRDELAALEGEVRRVLNDLMAHARAVSRGEIAPQVFAQPLPVLPRLKRRQGSSFASFWKRHVDDDASLLDDERFLARAIGNNLAPKLSVPPESAPLEAIERAADSLTELMLVHDDSVPLGQALRSLAPLPAMLDAPLERLDLRGTEVEALTGLEPFSRLERVTASENLLRDLSALASAAGLERLSAADNQIEDLSPLRALTALEELFVPGNQIESLEPLAGLSSLRAVTVAVLRPDGAPMSENPIGDARALARLPRLANPFVANDRLRISCFDATGSAGQTGVATRFGTTNRFTFEPDDGAGSEPLVVMTVREFRDVAVFPGPVVMVGVNFRDQGPGVFSTRPGDQTASLPAAELAGVLRDRFELTMLTGLSRPAVRFLEVAPA
jgi:hypothetical protein